MIEDGSFKMVEDGVLELINLYTKTEPKIPPADPPSFVLRFDHFIWILIFHGYHY